MSPSDSGLRLFAAAQLMTAGTGWREPGCNCYEVEYFDATAYAGQATGTTGRYFNIPNTDENIYCDDATGVGCVSWPAGATATLIVNNLGGMGIDSNLPALNGSTHKALFDIAIPGGGFGDFVTGGLFQVAAITQ